MADLCWSNWPSIQCSGHGKRRGHPSTFKSFPIGPGQVPCFIPFYPQPLSLRLSSHLCLDQHVLMLCLHLCMHGHPLPGGWFTLCLLIFFDDKYAHSSGPSLSWHFSYSLLSLSLACKHAQEYVFSYTCCCWHLGCLPKYRDEVKGKCPLVYDACFSEASPSFIMAFFWLFFAFFWCNSSGTQQTTCALGFKTELRFSARFHEVLLHVNWPAIPVLLTVHFLCLCWYIQSTYCWQSSVFFDTLSCIKGHYAHGLFPGHFFSRRSENGLLQCTGCS
uniref:Uncharacterized protein n=1 Tax=Opuntia streptacantha TaxID=393608 RepID=A0A7C8ZB71_OPUST